MTLGWALWFERRLLVWCLVDRNTPSNKKKAYSRITGSFEQQVFDTSGPSNRVFAGDV